MAKTIEIDIDVNADDAAKGVDKLGNEFDKLNESTEKTASSQDKLNDSLGVVGGGLAGAVGGAKKLLVAFKALALSPIGLVIGALATALFAVKRAFSDSEEGQNKYAKLMGVIGAITGNLMDLLADLGELIISAFENPKQALESFANLVKENIINRFEGLVELIPNVGKAIKLLFEGEFSEAGKVATNAVAKVTLGVDDLTGKIVAATEATKEFIKEQEREGTLAAQVADDRAKADLIERNLLVKRSKLESEIALLRLKSRQEDEFSAKERIQALLDAQKLEDELLDSETEVLELRRDAQILENTFSRSAKENLDAEAKAIAAVNNQVAARANTARQLQRELNTIKKQAAAQDKATQAEIDKEKEEDQKLKDEKEKERQNQILEDKKTAAQKEIELKQDIANAEQDLLNVKRSATETSLSLLEQFFGKNKAIAIGLIAVQKGLAIADVISNTAKNLAQITSNTFAANAATRLAYAAIPGGKLIAEGIVLNNNKSAAAGLALTKKSAAIQIGTIAATGLGKIASLQSSSVSTPSGGGSAAAPSLRNDALNPQETPLFNTENPQANNQNNVIKAVVIESDITTVQNRINDIENSAEIGS